MRKHNLLIICILYISLGGCAKGFKRLIEDEIHLLDGSTATGTLESADSSKVTLLRPDLSRSVVDWTVIDTIGSVGYRTAIASASVGVFSTPYYSAFHGEAYKPSGAGLQLRMGKASFGRSYRYVTLGIISGKPYGVTKLGVGFQRQVWKKYVDRWSMFAGLEANLMFVRNNNAPQFTMDPFVGADVQLLSNLRMQGRLGFQANFANVANELGTNLTLGISYHFRDFQSHYAHIMRHRTLPKRYNP